MLFSDGYPPVVESLLPTHCNVHHLYYSPFLDGLSTLILLFKRTVNTRQSIIDKSGQMNLKLWSFVVTSTWNSRQCLPFLEADNDHPCFGHQQAFKEVPLDLNNPFVESELHDSFSDLDTFWVQQEFINNPDDGLLLLTWYGLFKSFDGVDVPPLLERVSNVWIHIAEHYFDRLFHDCLVLAWHEGRVTDWFDG